MESEVDGVSDVLMLPAAVVVRGAELEMVVEVWVSLLLPGPGTGKLGPWSG